MFHSEFGIFREAESNDLATGQMMTIDIPNDWAPIIKELIASGSYGDESSIVAAGIRLLAAKEQLNADIEAGIRQLDRGESLPASDVYANARQRIRLVGRQGQ